MNFIIKYKLARVVNLSPMSNGSRGEVLICLRHFPYSQQRRWMIFGTQTNNTDFPILSLT